MNTPDITKRRTRPSQRLLDPSNAAQHEVVSHQLAAEAHTVDSATDSPAPSAHTVSKGSRAKGKRKASTASTTAPVDVQSPGVPGESESSAAYLERTHQICTQRLKPLPKRLGYKSPRTRKVCLAPRQRREQASMTQFKLVLLRPGPRRTEGRTGKTVPKQHHRVSDRICMYQARSNLALGAFRRR